MDESLNQEKNVGDAIDLIDLVTRAIAVVRSTIVSHKAEAISAALLLLMAANMLAIISRKSITNDEVVHIPAGYYHLVGGQFQLNNEHPPLVKMWAAIPLLFIQPAEPIAPKNPSENFMEQTWGYHARFWPANRENFEAVTFWPRVAMIPVTLGLGILIYIFTRRLFNPLAATLAVAMFSLEPTILAHGKIVHTDMPASFAYLAVVFTIFNYISRPKFRRALVVGIVMGIALVTKFSMIILFPTLIGLVVVGVVSSTRFNLNRKQILFHGLFVLALAILIVNAAYYFQRPPLEPSDVEWVRMKSAAHFGQIMAGFRALSRIFPTYFMFGVYNVWLHNSEGHPTALLGSYSQMGCWYYFPIAFAVKTTIPFLMVTVVSLSWMLWRLVAKRDRRTLFLLIPLAIYTTTSVTSNINIGIRHFLPVFPFLFIIAGGFLGHLVGMKKIRLFSIGFVLAMVVWMGFEAVRAFPDYVPYLNEIASAKPSWYYLSDSNIEWGDDVKALADYLKTRGESRVQAALSGGWSTLSQYDVEYLDLLKQAEHPVPRTHYIAIGASFLNGSTIPYWEEDGKLVTDNRRHELFSRFRTRTPEAVFGKTIYLFKDE